MILSWITLNAVSTGRAARAPLIVSSYRKLPSAQCSYACGAIADEDRPQPSRGTGKSANFLAAAEG